MQRLQEESEAREDARQQRLLEHERRMEERLICWEKQWREKEKKWDEERQQFWEMHQQEKEEKQQRERYGMKDTSQHSGTVQLRKISLEDELQDVKRLCQTLYHSVERLEEKMAGIAGNKDSCI